MVPCPCNEFLNQYAFRIQHHSVCSIDPALRRLLGFYGDFLEAGLFNVGISIYR